ncbi:MAG: hypothetical protein MUC74_07650 [Ideonella sp.]|jgi:hypothetical protein|nr:hypothetical protein [Ideonella sp.]
MAVAASADAPQTLVDELGDPRREPGLRDGLRGHRDRRGVGAERVGSDRSSGCATRALALAVLAA